LFLQCFSTDSNEGTELVSLARSFADQIPVHTVSGAQVLKHCAQHQCVGFVFAAPPQPWHCSHASCRVLSLCRGDPATAATPLAVTGLINRCRRKFGRGSEGNTAMLLVDVSGARQYDGMPLAAWFRRLGTKPAACMLHAWCWLIGMIGASCQAWSTIPLLHKPRGCAWCPTCVTAKTTWRAWASRWCAPC